MDDGIGLKIMGPRLSIAKAYTIPLQRLGGSHFKVRKDNINNLVVEYPNGGFMR